VVVVVVVAIVVRLVVVIVAIDFVVPSSPNVQLHHLSTTGE